MEWAGENFDSICVDLADTDKKYNYKCIHGFDDEEAHIKAREDGDRWIATNREAIDLLGPRVKVFRFDDWRAREGYQSIFDRLKAIYEQVDDPYCRRFREAVIADANEYVDLKASKIPNIDPERMRELSILYVLEEIAAVTVSELRYPGLRVYPGPQREPFRLVREGLLGSVNFPGGMVKGGYAGYKLKNGGKEAFPVRHIVEGPLSCIRSSTQSQSKAQRVRRTTTSAHRASLVPSH